MKKIIKIWGKESGQSRIDEIRGRSVYLGGAYEEKLARAKSLQSGKTSILAVRQSVPGFIRNLQGSDIGDVLVPRHVPIKLETRFHRHNLARQIYKEYICVYYIFSQPVQRRRSRKIEPSSRNSWRKAWPRIRSSPPTSSKTRAWSRAIDRRSYRDPMAVGVDEGRRRGESRGRSPIRESRARHTLVHRPRTRTRPSSSPVGCLKSTSYVFSPRTTIEKNGSKVSRFYQSCSSTIRSRRSRCRDDDACESKFNFKYEIFIAKVKVFARWFFLWVEERRKNDRFLIRIGRFLTSRSRFSSKPCRRRCESVGIVSTRCGKSRLDRSPPVESNRKGGRF